MNTSNISRVTATGDVTTVDSYLRGVTLTAGSDAATLTVRAGGSGGTVILTLKAAANTSVVVPRLTDVYCDGGIHATFSGTSPEASLVFV